MQRLCQHHEYEAVFAYDRAVSGGLFVVRVKPNGRSMPRLGIIAGKKSLPRAIDRNRGKRLVRETFRAAEKGLAPLDIVVQLRSGLLRHDNAAARRELLSLFTKLDECLAATARTASHAAMKDWTD